MYTNLSSHGGDFKNVLSAEFSRAKNVLVATGYASLDVINEYETYFTEIAREGGVSKLLLGMAFYEGLSSKKLAAALELNSKLREINEDCGVYVSYGRRYHGKVYLFQDDSATSIYVGSSNFSFNGIRGNIECTIPIIEEEQKTKLQNFLDTLYCDDLCLPIHKAEITVPGKKIVVQRTVENIWSSLRRYNPTTIDYTNLPYFNFPLARVAEQEKSNLNVYFGKGRLNTTNGKITPRPWYEIELIADRSLNSQTTYPKGDFLAYTDDGYIIPMRTQGANFKNIRSKGSLQIFGLWLKGKLEASGALTKYKPVTLDTLEEYGSTQLVFYKLSEGIYFMKF